MTINPIDTNYSINADYYVHFTRELIPSQNSQPPRAAATPLDRDTIAAPNLNRITNIHAASSHSGLDCIPRILQFFFDAFESIKNWVINLFFPESPSDPALLARWDAVVEKDYDPVGSPNPEYDEAYSACWRGRTAADALIKAASKTGVTPPFHQILVRRIGFEATGSLFQADSHGDGGYVRLAERARNGDFNNPETLIILATSEEDCSEERKRHLIDTRIRWGREARQPIEGASFFVLNANESIELSRNRMPASLLAFFQAHS